LASHATLPPSIDLRPLLRHRDHRALYAAQFVSFLGSMVTYVALPYQMFKITGSSLAVGLLGVAELPCAGVSPASRC